MTLLLLAGTRQARQIATALAEQGRPAIASLAGGARGRESWPVPLRVGGFGGADGFGAYIKEAGITAVLDATHPFAAAITNRTATLCAAMGLPYCCLHRPEWEPEAGDRWICLDHPEEAATHIPEGATVFLATGRGVLEQFANLGGRRLICRQIEPPDHPFPFEGGKYLVGTPPFSVAQERALFAELGVDWLITKNAGGAGPRTKLEAARALGLPVIMLNRPSPPDALIVRSVPEALSWVAAL